MSKHFRTISSDPLHIRNVIFRVKQELDHVLFNIQNIYQQNGIDFCVRSMYDALKRLLIPFEISKNNKFENQKEMPNFNKVKNEYQGNRENLFGYFHMKQPSYQQKYQQKKYSQKLSYTANLLNSRARPFLPKQAQQKLVEWIKIEIQCGKRLTRKDIADTALKMNKNIKNFHASSGWVSRFLGRHSELKELMGYKMYSYDKLKGSGESNEYKEQEIMETEKRLKVQRDNNEEALKHSTKIESYISKADEERQNKDSQKQESSNELFLPSEDEQYRSFVTENTTPKQLTATKSLQLFNFKQIFAKNYEKSQQTQKF